MRQRIKRILVVSPWACLPGHYWPCTTALSSALSRLGAKVAMLAPGISPQAGVLDGLCLDPVTRLSAIYAWLTKIDSSGRLPRTWSMLATLLWAAWKAASEDWDVVHVINGQQVAVALLTLLVPHIVVVNSLYGFPDAAGGTQHPISMGRRIREAVVRHAVATGRLWLVIETSAILRAFEPVYGSHVVEIPYSLAPPELLADRLEARRELGLPEQRFIFLVFGTHRTGKDYETVISALGMANDRAMVFFAGKLISDNDPHKHAAALPVHRTAFLDGFISDRQMALAFAASDVVLIPYEGDFERGSGVLMEAVRYLRPVLATDAGHLRAFVTQHSIGLLYRVADAEDLSAQMEHMMRPGFTEEFAPAIIETGRLYSWDVSVQRYLSLYNSTLDRGLEE